MQHTCFSRFQHFCCIYSSRYIQPCLCLESYLYLLNTQQIEAELLSIPVGWRYIRAHLLPPWCSPHQSSPRTLVAFGLWFAPLNLQTTHIWYLRIWLSPYFPFWPLIWLIDIWEISFEGILETKSPLTTGWDSENERGFHFSVEISTAASSPGNEKPICQPFLFVKFIGDFFWIYRWFVWDFFVIFIGFLCDLFNLSEHLFGFLCKSFWIFLLCWNLRGLSWKWKTHLPAFWLSMAVTWFGKGARLLIL